MSILLEGPSPHEIPGLRWEDTITSDLLKRNLNMEMVSSRSTWRDAVNRSGSNPVQVESRESGNNDELVGV